MSKSPSPFLSKRQRQCLHYVGRGLSSKEIARELGISPSTVDNHVRLGMERLNTTSRIEAANLVAQQTTSAENSIPVTVIAMKTIAHSLNQIVNSFLVRPGIWKGDSDT